MTDESVYSHHLKIANQENNTIVMDTRKLKIIELSGTPRERGRIHGEELREHIRSVLEITKSGIEKNHSVNPDDYIRSFLTYANFESAIQQFAPDIMEEVDGLAEGAAIDTDTALYLQLTDEVTEFIPWSNSPAVCHSNAPLANRDIDPETMSRFKNQAGLDENFKARYESIWHRLGHAEGDRTVKEAKAALSAHDDPSNPVSRTFDSKSAEKFLGYTAGSMIYQLDRDDPVLHLASGPPCQTMYHEFRFNR